MYKLEITTRIGCKNQCKYCPQDKLIKNYPTNDPKIINKKTLKISEYKQNKDKMSKNFSSMIDIQKEEFINKINITQNFKSGEKNFNEKNYQNVENFSLKDDLTSSQKTENLCNYLEELKLKNNSKEDEIKIENLLGVKRKNRMLKDINSLLFNENKIEHVDINAFPFPSKKLKS